MPGDPTRDWLRKKQTDKKPYKPVPLKSYNQESWTWLQQAEQNIEQLKSNKLNKPGSISLLKAPVSKTNDGKPRKKPPCYQVPFIGVPRLPKYIRKQMRGKISKPWPTMSFKRV